MSRGLGVLLRCQWRLVRNAWRPDSRGRSHLIAAIFVLPLFMFMFFVFAIYFLRSSGLPRTGLPGALRLMTPHAITGGAIETLVISTTAIFFIISLGALQQAFETFYLAPDLPLLLASPISRQAVLTVKLLLNVRWDALMVFMTALPLWIAFGIWLRASPGFYLVLILGWLCLLLFVSAVAVVLTAALVRIVPVPRLRQIVLSFLFGFILLAIVLIQGAVSGAWGREDMPSLLGRGLLTQQMWLPSIWLSRGLLALATGNPQEAWPWLAGLGIGTALAVIGAYGVGLRIYAQGWTLAQQAESLAGRRHRHTKAKSWSRSVSPLLALVYKDLRLFSRQPIEWYRAALGLVAMATALVVFTAEERQAASAVVLSFAMGFVGASTFAVSLSLRGVSKEGLSWWIIQASPLTEGAILWAKFLTAFIPTGIYACLAMMGMQIALKLPLFVLPLSIPIMLVMVAGLTALDLAIGIWRADFHQAAETRNADIVAVLVSQAANYFLLSPALILPSLSILWASPSRHVELLRSLQAEAVLLVPLNALIIVLARRYSLKGIRALRLSEGIKLLRSPRQRADISPSMQNSGVH
jgi:hypothetical protein